MVEELVSRLFALRDSAHLAHWATRSYAEHMALGDFYDALDDKIDSIIETYQGCFGLIGDVKPRDYSKKSILKQIADEANWIAQHRDDIAQDNDVLANMIDDLGATYAVAHYKLKFLS